MQKFKTLADATRLAEFAHFSQVDKAGLPYIDHPKRVLAKVQAQGALPYVQIAAILHDVTEDTAFSSYILLALGFSEAAVRIVRLLDRDHSYNVYYKNYVGYSDDPNKEGFKGRVDEFYYRQIAANREATLVKLADIEDNLSPWRQAYLEPATQERLALKYAKARAILEPERAVQV